MRLTSRDAQLAGRLLAYLRPHFWYVLLAIGTIGLTAATALAQPMVLKTAIDRFIATQQLDGINELALAYVLVILVGYAAEAMQTWSLQLTGQHMMFDMRSDIYKHLHRLDISYHDRHPVGGTMARVIADVDAMNEVFTSGVATICTDVVTIVGIIGVMLWLDWRVALAALAALPAVAVLTRWFRRRIRAASMRVRDLTAQISAFLQEKIAGIIDLQLFRREVQMFQRFAALNRQQRDANVVALFYYSSFPATVEVAGACASALIIWYGGRRVLGETLTLGALTAFLHYTLRLFRPVGEMAEKFNVLQSASASAERLFSFLDESVAVKSPARGVAPSTARGHIAFEHVWFAYGGERPDGSEPEWVLKDVSFEVLPGSGVAIVGATGSGKTTILNLLVRFYDVQRGRITLDGIDVREYDLRTLRSQFGVVFQDVHVLSGTIADNIRFGRSAITDAQIRRAANVADAESFVAALPGRYDASTCERGATLSGGQKQQLSFARALAGEPLVLILDEATSNVDAWTEARIHMALAHTTRGQTVIAIAHRLSAIQNVEKIVVLHKGVVRESGRHDELLARQGIYFQLFELESAAYFADAPTNRTSQSVAFP